MQSKAISPELFAQLITAKSRQRFWSKIDIGEPDECWQWKHSVCSAGYGQFKCGSKFIPDGYMDIGAHRIAWMLWNNRPIPERMHVLHSCIANHACCNPKHLRLGTEADNSADKVAQGRQSRMQGERSTAAKLTTCEVLEIRNLSHRGLFNGKQLAKIYNISKQHISAILLRKAWKHV